MGSKFFKICSALHQSLSSYIVQYLPVTKTLRVINVVTFSILVKTTFHCNILLHLQVLGGMFTMC